MPRLLFFICVLLSIATRVNAQITGQVIDANNSAPLEYATAALFKTQDSSLVEGIITDSNGIFKLERLSSGPYYLKISFIGYKTKTLGNYTFDRNTQAIDLGTILLESGQVALAEVVVETEKVVAINKIDKQVFDTESFQNAQGGSGTDLLRNLPSVSVNGLGEISVRGSTGFVLLLNGRPIQGTAATLLNQFPANSIERVEVITTPSAKYDPEGKAGLINIIVKKGTGLGDYAQLNFRAGAPPIERYGAAEYPQRYGADVTYNIQRDKWNISLGANYQRYDITGRREGDVFTISNDTLTQFPSDGERSFDEINFSGRFTVDYTPDSTNTFSLGFYAGKRSKDRTADILYFDNQAITPVENGNRIYTLQYFNENLRIRRGDFVLGSFDYSHQFQNTSKLSTSLLYEYTLLGGPTTNRNLGFPDTQVLFQDEFNTNDNPLHGIRFQVDYRFATSTIGQFEVGYQYRYLDHTGDFVYERRDDFEEEFELVPEFSSEVDLKRTINSGYVQFSGKQKKWEYSAGVRLEAMRRDFDLRDKIGVIDTTFVYDFVKPFPSAALQYTTKKGTKLKVSYSKRIERTTTFKMNPFPEREHSETLEQGDPTLLPEFIDLIELGIAKNYGNGNSIFATAYFRNTKNLVNRVNTVFNDTILNRIYSNVGRGRSLGMEVGLQMNPTKSWSNFIGGNVYNYDIDGQFDNRPVSTNSWIYSINTNSTFDFSATASFQFTFNYLSARNTAQGEDSRFYNPNLSFRKSFLDDRLVATLQWQNIDLGWLNSNEQRITTSRANEFFTTTNYVYEVDVILLNLSYSLNNRKDKSRFIESEFGKREF